MSRSSSDRQGLREPFKNKGRRSRSNGGKSNSQEKQKSSHQDASDKGNVVHVRNLSTKTTEDRLKDKFSEYGKIEDVNILRERDTGRFGFIYFKSKDEAEAAISANEIELDGRMVKIERAKRSRARDPTPGQYLGKPRVKRRSPYRSRRYSRSHSRSRSHEYRRRRHRRSASRSRSNSRRRRRSYSRSYSKTRSRSAHRRR